MNPDTDAPAAPRGHTAFLGHRLLASGDLLDVALAVQKALKEDAHACVLVSSDETGRPVDLDLRGGRAGVQARYARAGDAGAGADPCGAQAPRGRGRPRLGVVAREVTLLPEHWDWLAAQPGGASVALRKLVHQARRAAAAQDAARAARERAYAFMAAACGDLPGFEEASRALFAGDLQALGGRMARWPRDLCQHVLRLAGAGGAVKDAAA